ncbi:MAG: molybdopterin molybdotransferase MoeA [Polyangiaceae bacterium]|nr:molybdopterin molybdotransferase MoeA [Polyangiaceae bacterium]MCL4752704.1 molybdopterin molybdotransferase MoeA [Myxococcales bacterium]
MLSFDEARERILRDVEPLGTERALLADALGRVLAEALTAAQPMPAFDYSAMDGYAVRSADLSGAGPWSLPVAGESRTGATPPELAAGAACRIFTGAALPLGADAVVMQEDVERDGEQARFESRPAVGSHVRKRGEDLDVGGLGLAAGTRLGPAQIGLAAAMDRAELPVFVRPRVSILCTGDELRAPGSPARPGSIPESNGQALSATLRVLGAAPRLLPYVRDDREATLAAVRDALSGADLLLTVGGVSVGEHDLVRPALEAAGARLDFWKVAIRPGKPLVFGRCGATRILGLPGNPVSAQVTFALFGAPLVRMLAGDRKPVPGFRRARLTQAVRQKAGRMSFVRGTLDGDAVTPLPNQASGAPTSMAWADCLLVVPAESEGFAAGAEVSVLALGSL